MRITGSLAAILLAGAVAGCSDSLLQVDNPNNPDRGRVLGNPADVEALASSQFQQIISGTLGSITRVETGLMTASFMNASTLANDGLGPRSGIPRQPIDNNRGNAYQSDNYNDFRILTAVARNSADILERAKDADFKLPGGTSDLNRLIGWSHFTYGTSLGYLALVYDSTGVPRPGDVGVPALEYYPEVIKVALAQYDSALAYLAKGASTIPTGWLTGSGGPAVTVADFTKIVRSFAARMRAGVARTPTERAAVEWAKVIADANAGITADFEIAYAPSTGWDHNWMSSTLHFRDANWHQMTYYAIGFADTSGAFEAWLNVPRDARMPFLIKTPDARFPRGDTREAQNADRGAQEAPSGGKYFRNRLAGGDQAGTGWQNSMYDHWRFRAWSQASRIGPKPLFTKAENDMLAAEGYIRTNNIPAAAALIDRTRTVNDLPALAGVVTTATQAIPGGNACVPRVTKGTSTSTQCGDIMEAMKWEKRMETAYTTYGAWFFDSRGWGDMPEGTPVMWPVPVQELDARQAAKIYNLGGIGQTGGAGKSTYGYGEGNK